LKPEFSRDKDGRAPNESFLTECNRLHWACLLQLSFERQMTVVGQTL
jgi:hypothetical protein